MIEIEINGKKTIVDDGTTIIEAADAMDIYIPRFCYHKKLSIAANCRMCLVEVEKVGKPLPACATPVTPGMKVFTQSKKALDAQRAVMEFLLINHPLDCPICDQGGECELQDLAMGFGRSCSNYDEPKRSVFSDDIGPLIETEMTRCIQCTRCVRFGEEIAGLRELGVIGRGEKEEITTYVQHFLKSELSGNIIDICPVGALTDKPARYNGRGWEYREHPSVSPHDCVGTNTFVHNRWEEYSPQRKVMRAVPRENDAINENWISDRDRYSHFGLYHESRVYRPRMKKGTQWVEVGWETALQAVTSCVKAVVEKEGANQIAALASPNSTVEEFYLLQKLLRSLGSPHIDHRFRQQDFSDQQLAPTFPSTNIPIADIPNLNAILLVGSNVRFEQPILSHRMNQAFLEEAKIMAVNAMDYDYIFNLHQKIIAPSQQMVLALAEIAKALAEEAKQNIAELADITPSEHAKEIASTLKKAGKAGIFIGEHALNHPNASEIRAMVQLIAKLSDAKTAVLTEGANVAGAWLAGAIPHRGPAGAELDKKGLDAKALLTTDALSGYFLLNFEPELDCAYSAAALKALNDARFVVCLTPFATAEMEKYADFILPITNYVGTAGTYVNVEGTWQSFSAISLPEEDSKPAWKVLRVLGNLLELNGFDYKTVHEVHHEIKKQVDEMSAKQPGEQVIPKIKLHQGELMRLAPWPMYRANSLVRRSAPLQETLASDIASIALNAKTAAALNLQEHRNVTAVQGDSRVTLPLVINDKLADDTVLIPCGLQETAGFGQAEAAVILEQA